MTINGITFDINAILVPNALPCPPGSAPGSCSFGDFTFTQLDFNTSGAACPGGISPCGHVLVGFSANGIGYTGTSATGSTPYTFTWSSQFTTETTQDLINKATTGAVLDAVSFTASPTGVPEPVSMALIGGGLIALAALKRHKRA